jgi:hypothetical protein
MGNRKESMSKTGFGVGFVSKQNRFSAPSSTLTSKQPSHMLELIYQRAASSPGPGHYESVPQEQEIGGKILLNKLKRAWQFKKKEPLRDNSATNITVK